MNNLDVIASAIGLTVQSRFGGYIILPLTNRHLAPGHRCQTLAEVAKYLAQRIDRKVNQGVK